MTSWQLKGYLQGVAMGNVEFDIARGNKAIADYRMGVAMGNIEGAWEAAAMLAITKDKPTQVAVIDTVVDVGFVGYDLYRIAVDNLLPWSADGLSTNLFALAADLGATVVPGVTGGGLAVRAGLKYTDNVIGFTRAKLQHGFKHAADFGILGNPNNKTLTAFSEAIHSHVTSPSVKAISGTYRGQPVTHFVDPSTGLNVMRDVHNTFLGGWKLSHAQLEHVLNSGKLGGGK